tara:strand:+ start:142 stop:1341 length:1200 start_codon:yes stop_codon:yes gene_type:complete
MKKVIRNEVKYLAGNYKSKKLVISRGKDIYLYDSNGKKYYDFMAGYSAVNQGHCHPRIVNKLVEQSQILTLSSRAFMNESLSKYGKYICNLFDYDKILPTNTGVEAGETAIKLVRSWGYKVKKIPDGKASVVFANDNFWGRSIAALSSSTDPIAYEDFGPYTPGFYNVPYNNLSKIQELFEEDRNICAIMLEPIQGEAGIILPHSNYLIEVQKLCKKYNVLLICDEVQTGLGRMGSMIACEYFNIKPDILLLGKALSGGMFPVSAVLANKDIMCCMYPNTHGSTYGGSALSSAVAMESLKTLIDEDMIDNSKSIGSYFRKELKSLNKDNEVLVRGLGLMNAIQFRNDKIAGKFVDELIKSNVLTKITRGDTIRLTPPLTIKKNDCDVVLDKINKILKIL